MALARWRRVGWRRAGWRGAGWRRAGWLIGLLPLVAACAVEQPALWESDNPVLPLPPPPLGVDSRLTSVPDPPTPERIRLGRWLFFDARLSEGVAQSCASCHRPDRGYSQATQAGASGTGLEAKRKTAAIVNVAWASPPGFFWDGRAESLEAVSIGAPGNLVATDGPHRAQPMVNALVELGVYERYFQEAYGRAEVTSARVAKALADFERSIVSGDSAWDRWKRWSDQRAVGPEAKAGDALFFGKAGCARCHSGESFTDRRFHNLGVGWDAVSATFADEGRFAVTQDRRDLGAFKTPALRDVATRAPYMHDGSVATLRQAVEWHVRGGRPNPHLDPMLMPGAGAGAGAGALAGSGALAGPGALTDADITALVKFLESLTSLKAPDMGPATFPR